MSRGSAAKSSSVRTSRSAGHFRVPMRRASFSEVMLLIEDMARPCKERDAILQHVASWGDRFPISLAQPKRTASVKVRAGAIQSDAQYAVDSTNRWRLSRWRSTLIFE